MIIAIAMIAYTSPTGWGIKETTILGYHSLIGFNPFGQEYHINRIRALIVLNNQKEHVSQKTTLLILSSPVLPGYGKIILGSGSVFESGSMTFIPRRGGVLPRYQVLNPALSIGQQAVATRCNS